MPRPIEQAKREAILADIEAGELTCRAIAEKHGVAASTVSALAPAGAFERSQTQKATSAKSALMAERRAAQAFEDLAVSDLALKRLKELIPRARSVKDVAIAYGITVDKHLVLARFDSDDGASDAASLVKGLADGLSAAYDAMTGGGGDRPPAGPEPGQPEAAPLDR